MLLNEWKGGKLFSNSCIAPLDTVAASLANPSLLAPMPHILRLVTITNRYIEQPSPLNLLPSIFYEFTLLVSLGTFPCQWDYQQLTSHSHELIQSSKTINKKATAYSPKRGNNSVHRHGKMLFELDLIHTSPKRKYEYKQEGTK